MHISSENDYGECGSWLQKRSSASNCERAILWTCVAQVTAFLLTEVPTVGRHLSTETGQVGKNPPCNVISKIIILRLTLYISIYHCSLLYD